MIQRFQGIDRHKKSSTISVLNREGEEIRFYSACYNKMLTQIKEEIKSA
jgi:hypothetical protein